MHATPVTDTAPHPAVEPTAPPEDDFDGRFEGLVQLSYRIAYRMLGSREEAQDVAQEALARAYARWAKVHGTAPAWVGRVTTNLAIDVIRKRRRPPPAPDPSGPDAAHVAALRTDLGRALRRLPRRQRDVVVLRYLADLSEADTARALGCTTGTVKQHAHRGLAALRASLTPDPAIDVPTDAPTDTPTPPMEGTP